RRDPPRRRAQAGRRALALPVPGTHTLAPRHDPVRGSARHSLDCSAGGCAGVLMSDAMSFPTRVVFGAGSLRELPAELARVGAHRPLLVVDRGIVGAGLLRRLTDVLESAGIAFVAFERDVSNPVEENVREGVEAYKRRGCD